MEFVAEQWVPRPIDEVFRFFSDEKNLERITPPWLSFRVLGKSTPEIREGTLIDYELRLHGIPLRWQTRIESWQPGRSFVDTQVRGPYTLWRHTHTFASVAGGTQVSDHVEYRVPGGWLGRIALGWYVRGDIERIFAFRRKAIAELFPEPAAERRG